MLLELMIIHRQKIIEYLFIQTLQLDKQTFKFQNNLDKQKHLRFLTILGNCNYQKQITSLT